jgi:prefoldin subunit 5
MTRGAIVFEKKEGSTMGFLDKAKEVLSENAEKVEAAIDKAGDFIDEKTQGKFSETVDKVQDAAKSAVDKGQDALKTVTDKGHEAGEAVADKAHEAGQAVADKAHEAGDAVADKADPQT